MVQLTPDEPVPIAAAVGVAVEIALPASPTTGYVWTPRAVADVAFLERRFAPRDAAVGAGGTLTVAFKVLRPGRVRIVFDLARPWDPGTVLQTRTFDVDAE